MPVSTGPLRLLLMLVVVETTLRCERVVSPLLPLGVVCAVCDCENRQ
jgi:hypothetical protein